MRIILSLLLISFALFASDSRTSQSEHLLHNTMRAYYQQPEEQRAQNWWNRPYLTGDWGGIRATLASAGVTIISSYTTDMVGNPVGGKARGFAYAGSYGASVNINCTKAGLTNFELFCSAVWRTGTSLSRDKIGNQFPVQQVFGSQTVRLNELHFVQTLFNNNLVLKVGRLDAGNDFLASPLYGQFVNNGFDGNPISIFFNVPITAYPNATWGAYLHLRPFTRLAANFGVYNANTYIQQNKYHGCNFTFKNTNGLIWITEWCALINQEPTDHGMPGNYKVGFFYLTGNTPKFTGGLQKGDPCLYFLFDQMIYRRGGPKSTQGLTPFIAIVLAPRNRNLFPLFIDGGLCFKGLFPSRPDDTASIGYVYGKYSSIKAQVEMDHGLEAQNFESVLELNYWIQPNQWLSIVPDFQYIIHPKGRSIPNAYVLGVQIGIVL